MMGTNYYVPAKPDCPCCGRGFEPLHIGKSSGGWKFLFAPYPELGLTSWKAWREYIASSGATIMDEYDRAVSLDELEQLVERKQRPEMLDADNADYEQWGPMPRSERHKIETKDAEGYRFSRDADFS